MKLTNSDVTALEVLFSGGYFREMIEDGWHGPKNVTRLIDRNRQPVKGFGYAAFRRLRDAGVMAQDSYWRFYGSCMETRYNLAESVLA